MTFLYAVYYLLKQILQTRQDFYFKILQFKRKILLLNLPEQKYIFFMILIYAASKQCPPDCFHILNVTSQRIKESLH